MIPVDSKHSKGITNQHTKFGLFLTKALQHVVFDLTQGLGRYHGVVTVTTLFVKTTRPKNLLSQSPVMQCLQIENSETPVARFKWRQVGWTWATSPCRVRYTLGTS